MTGRRYTLSKTERLSWKRYIDLLFAEGESFVAYPLRVIYLPVEQTMGVPVSFLISVSKKRFKRAVKRNAMKRLAREAFRLHKADFQDVAHTAGKELLLAFLYLDKEIATYADMEKAMLKAVRLLREKLT